MSNSSGVPIKTVSRLIVELMNGLLEIHYMIAFPEEPVQGP